MSKLREVKTPEVSVIIPTYKHRNYVREALESVFTQTFKDYEVIVVNDGSPDDTADILAPYIADGLIIYLDQKNKGQGAARNRGIALARGQYVAFLDDDDIWLPDNLERQVAMLSRSPTAVLSYGDVITFPVQKAFTQHLQTSPRPVKETLLIGNLLVTPGQTVIRRDVLDKVGGFDADIWGCDDWDLYLRLADSGPFLYAGHTAIQYRLHLQNASRNRLRMFENAVKMFRKAHLSGSNQEECWRIGKINLSRTGARFAIDECCEKLRGRDHIAGWAGLAKVARLSPSVVLRRSVWRQVWRAITRGGSTAIRLDTER